MNSSSRTGPFSEATFRALEMHFVLKITTFRAPATYPDFTKCCACHEKWHSNITKCCACHKKWHSKITKCCACHEKWHCNITNIAPATKSDTATSPNVAPATKKDTPTSPRKVTFQLHQILHLPQKLTLCYLIEPLLDWAVTLLSCYFTDLLLYWTATLLSCYSTEFFAFLNLRNSEVSHLNFLWLKPQTDGCHLETSHHDLLKYLHVSLKVNISTIHLSTSICTEALKLRIFALVQQKMCKNSEPGTITESKTPAVGSWILLQTVEFSCCKSL